MGFAYKFVTHDVPPKPENDTTLLLEKAQDDRPLSKEAEDVLLSEARRMGSVLGYIWPQTFPARQKVARMYNSDYLRVAIEVNTPERKKYSVAGELVGVGTP